MRTTLLPVAALTLLAFFLRRYHLGDESFWFDEADIVARARQPLPTLLGGFTQAGENGPLYTLILHFWLLLMDAVPLLEEAFRVLFGESDEAPVRALPMLLGTATIPVIYLLAHRVGGHALGVTSAALLAINPFHIWHSQDAKMYTLLVLMTLVGSLLYLVAWERNTWPLWLAYVLSTWVMLTSHSMGLLVLFAQLSVTPFIVRARRHQLSAASRVAVKWGWAMLLILGPIFPLAWLRGAALLTGTADVGGWYTPAGLSDIVGTLAVNYSVNRAAPAWEWIGAMSMAVLAFVGILALYKPLLERSKDIPLFHDDQPNPQALPFTFHASRSLLIAMFIVPLLGFWLVTLKLPLFQARYLIMALPGYVILAGAGAVWLWGRGRFGAALAAVYGGLLGAASVAALVGVNYSSVPQKEDWRGAMVYVMDHARLRDLVIVFPGYLETAVNLYYKPGGPERAPDIPIKTVPSLGTEGFGERELYRTLFEAVKCHERAWLVTSPAREEQEDPEHLVRHWLQFNWRTFDTREFNGVTVYGVAFNGQPDCWWPEPTNPERHTFENGIEFLGYIYELRANATTQPDASYFPLTLYWRSPPRQLTTDYEVRVIIGRKDGQVVKEETLPPHNGFWPTTEWPPSANIIDYRDIRLPGGMVPGEYVVKVQLHPNGQPDQPLKLVGGVSELVFEETLRVVEWGK